MVDLTSLLNPDSILQFAGMNDAMGWVGVGISLLLQILIGGLILVVIMEIFGHHWGESINPLNAFFAIIIATFVNMFGIMGVLSSMLSLGYYGGILLSIAVWFILIKLFFREFEIKHVIIVSLVVVVANMILLPIVMSFVLGLLGF